MSSWLWSLKIFHTTKQINRFFFFFFSVGHIRGCNESSLVLSSVFNLSPCMLPIVLSVRGKSTHRKLTQVHLQYSFTVQSTIFLFQMKPQLPDCWFSSSSLLLSFFFLSLFFFFFSECCVTGLWFTHYQQCTGSVLWQNMSLSLFPRLT